MSDRQVHARLGNGDMIVRYDKAGKWYLEHPMPPGGRRCPLTLSEAVHLASRNHATRYWNLPGGRAFDARLRRAMVAADEVQP